MFSGAQKRNATAAQASSSSSRAHDAKLCIHACQGSFATWQDTEESLDVIAQAAQPLALSEQKR